MSPENAVRIAECVVTGHGRDVATIRVGIARFLVTGASHAELSTALRMSRAGATAALDRWQRIDPIERLSWLRLAQATLAVGVECAQNAHHWHDVAVIMSAAFADAGLIRDRARRVFASRHVRSRRACVRGVGSPSSGPRPTQTSRSARRSAAASTTGPCETSDGPSDQAGTGPLCSGS